MRKDGETTLKERQQGQKEGTGRLRGGREVDERVAEVEENSEAEQAGDTELTHGLGKKT